MSVIQAYITNVCLWAWIPGAGANLPVVAYSKALSVMCVVTVVDHVLAASNTILLCGRLLVTSRRRRRCASGLLRPPVGLDPLKRLLCTHDIGYRANGCVAVHIRTHLGDAGPDEEGRFGETVRPPRTVVEKSSEGSIPRTGLVEGS